MVGYRPRLVDSQLQRRLSSAGAVLLEGPKACGKTTTARQVAKSWVRLDVDPAARAAGLADPGLLLRGETPRLIDEWQRVPEVWNAVRAAVDDRQADGQFILTGSATPAEEHTRHTGAMRIARLRMGPMTLLESGESTGQVSLRELVAGEMRSATEPGGDLLRVAELACRGGWPSNLRRDLADARAANRDYLATIAGADIVTVDGVRRDPRKVAALVHALARSTGTYVTIRTLAADVESAGATLAARTISEYLDALARLWVLAEQPAWGGHLRSSAQVRRSPKRHLVDPSLAAAALNASPQSLIADPEAFGQIFESLVYRDLSGYAQAIDATVACYQDNNGAEMDAVLLTDDGWAGFEVKLSSSPAVVDAAAANLRRIANRMRTAPRALAVITATGSSYRRPDGVVVLSIQHLGP